MACNSSKTFYPWATVTNIQYGSQLTWQTRTCDMRVMPIMNSQGLTCEQHAQKHAWVDAQRVRVLQSTRARAYKQLLPVRAMCYTAKGHITPTLISDSSQQRIWAMMCRQAHHFDDNGCESLQGAIRVWQIRKCCPTQADPSIGDECCADWNRDEYTAKILAMGE